ncbi:MAG TPA: hypothetical protein VIV11_06870 [Kofleriaceae bacterium]
MRTLLLISLLLVGCRDRATKPPPSNQEGSVAPRVALTDPLALVPADSDIVLRVDIAALRRSSFFAKYEQQMLELIAPAFVECGFNPLEEITTITVGIPMASQQGIFVIRGLDRDKTLACLKSSKVESRTKVTFDGDFVTLTNKSGAVNMVTFVEPTTMVMQGSKNPTKQTLTKALQMGAPLRGNAMVASIDKQLGSGAAMSVIFVPDSKWFKQAVAAQGIAARYAYATLHVSEGLRWNVSLVMDNAQAAAAFANQVRAQLEEQADAFEKRDVRVEGATVVLDLGMSAEQLESIIAIVQMMMAGNSD